MDPSEVDNSHPPISHWENLLVGKVLVPDEEKASTPNGISREDLPAKNRVLGPNSPMTRDYRPDRLNVFIDENNVVLSVNYS